MRFSAKLILAIIVNGVVLYFSAQWIPSIALTGDLRTLGIIAAALTALNFFLKPLLKLILSPVIILTLGLGLLLVNAGILYLLDFLFTPLTIGTTVALIKLTLVMSAANGLFHFATRK